VIGFARRHARQRLERKRAQMKCSVTVAVKAHGDWISGDG
jgi:hypothetical protein